MKIIFLIASILLTALSGAYAHPHLFIDPHATFIFENNMLKGIKMTWVFDEMWSQQVIMECDRNMDNALSSKESAFVEKEYFSNIKDCDYFMKFKIGNNPIAVPKHNNFKAVIDPKSQILKYEFYFPLEVDIGGERSIKVIFIDPTNFTAFGINLQSLRVRAEGIKASANAKRYQIAGCEMTVMIGDK